MSPDYFVESYLTSDKDDDCEITVRRHGKLIYLRISPSQFQESPQVTAYYLKCLEILRSGEEVIDDFYDDEAQEWLLKPFVQLMEKFTHEPSGGLGTPTLADYYFPDFFVFTLDAEHEEFRPRRVETQEPPRIPWVWISDTLAQDFGGWTTLYPPCQVEICYDRSQDVLNKPPRRVRINGRQGMYFFKPFCAGGSREEVSQELQAFKHISMANLDPKARVCRLHGIVGEGNRLLGMLLTFIDERLPLNRAKASASASLRKQWAAQIELSLAQLHKNGLVWGDVKPHNVLIDTNDDAWLVDFGGSYTEGWVDREEAGTVKGDLHGLARILDFLS